MTNVTPLKYISSVNNIIGKEQRRKAVVHVLLSSYPYPKHSIHREEEIL